MEIYLKSFLGKLVKLSKRKTVFRIVFSVDLSPVQYVNIINFNSRITLLTFYFEKSLYFIYFL